MEEERRAEALRTRSGGAIERRLCGAKIEPGSAWPVKGQGGDPVIVLNRGDFSGKYILEHGYSLELVYYG